MTWLFEKLDRGTAIMLLLLSTISVIAVHSATWSREPEFLTGSAGKQMFFALFGVVIYLVAQKIDYHDWAELAYILYWGGIVLLVLVLFTSPIANARSWFVIGPLRFQPSEPMKTLTVLACAAYLSNTTARLDFRRLLTLTGIVALPMGLILLQPDMGSALTYVPMLLGIAWFAGLRPRVLVTLAVLAALMAPVGWFTVLKPYQKERIITVFDPERDPKGAGYQVKQSRIAVGSGEILGKGLYQGVQSRLEYLPARETDFILAVVGEEAGFVGVLVALGLQLGLLLRGMKTAGTAQDYLGSIIAVGIVSLWAGQTFINTGMVTGIVPTIGVPFPGLSYGGSSVVATFMAWGIVSSVRSGRIVNA